MKTETLDYHLPPELIAQHPKARRSDSRMLVLNRKTGDIIDRQFHQLGDFLSPQDCLILNNTKVVPARFFARRATGAKIEGLFLDQTAPVAWSVMLKGTRKLKQGETLDLKDKDKNDCCKAVLLEKLGQGKCLLKIEGEPDALSLLQRIGFPPLPPYIKRDDDAALAEEDRQRYQTVYAAIDGAVAAPTAGLHFTDTLIRKLKHKGIDFAHLTLHVGAGTFKPVTAENLEDHEIHAERFSLDAQNADRINDARNAGKRIIAVGTTSVRTLESLPGPPVSPADGTTRLFITPGYRFKYIDAMITNFHLPRSTLLALVAAFAGLDKTLAAYRHAIAEKYRFYSYGDAMLII
ncbi:MAG: tRNA preQ1(34) S-adenosylmethionine ribosyltransferase-isomerase QueA [Sedimentisphaerales bacterium]|nr:tRNA preQ1(34) S-adenosylmethionine ribosyltransferase-isomerase QueA [Sedimentisphaerales bacterium]